MLIRVQEYLAIAGVWTLYACSDWIADHVVSGVCPMSFLCV